MTNVGSREIDRCGGPDTRAQYVEGNNCPVVTIDGSFIGSGRWIFAIGWRKGGEGALSEDIRKLVYNSQRLRTANHEIYKSFDVSFTSSDIQTHIEFRPSK